ncbi:hypothetical protein PG994_004316 [Apiospora phragmitis]|uniref:MYND-type domain-containing protein n=1 Tax=Apiospora phragmitis TaxID=2905665 RepID=A0ABR1VRF2_9PEZI
MENTNEATQTPEATAEEAKPKWEDETKGTGSCIVCGNNTGRLCYTCGAAFVCSMWCNAETPRIYWPAYHSHEKTSADDLKLSVASSDIPTDPVVCKHFGFDRCTSAEERSQLAGVFHIVLVEIAISPPQLNGWREAKLLHKNIAKLLASDHRNLRDEDPYISPVYPAWFKSHADVFDGGIHATDASAETRIFWGNLQGHLNLGLHLKASRWQLKDHSDHELTTGSRQNIEHIGNNGALQRILHSQACKTCKWTQVSRIGIAACFLNAGLRETQVKCASKTTPSVPKRVHQSINTTSIFLLASRTIRLGRDICGALKTTRPHAHVTLA